jgi:hypothetical protein
MPPTTTVHSTLSPFLIAFLIAFLIDNGHDASLRSNIRDE